MTIQSNTIPKTITNASDLCALIGENKANDTAAEVVIIATNSMVLTSSRFLEERLYQKAPSTATPMIIGKAIASIIENVIPKAERIPNSAVMTSTTPPMVTAATIGSLNPMANMAPSNNKDGKRM